MQDRCILPLNWARFICDNVMLYLVLLFIFIWLLVLNIDYVFDILINVQNSSMKRRIGDIKNCEDM
jgi:hypothetical protein